MSATVIVPTWRGAQRIGALLDSLARQTVDHRVLVVDNASSDGTSEILERYPDVDVIRKEENLGFGRAVNLAAAHADSEAIVLVNDDCVCDPGFVEAIVRPLGDRLVMSAGVMRHCDDERLIETAGMQLDPALLVFDYLHGETIETLERAPAPIGPSGAAAAFDRAAFLDVGGFDEVFFAYWEDVDLVLRMRLAGGTSALAADAQGTHMHSASLGSGSAEKNRLMGFGRGYVLRKWSVLHGPRALRVLAHDGAICAGQAVIDRNLASLTGRVRGWRAAEPSFGYPGALLRDYAAPGMGEDLGRRLRRRRRIARTRLEREAPEKGIERTLGATSPWRASENGAFTADLTTLPPRVIRVGEGNVLFLGGRTEGGGAPGRVEILVNGAPSGEAVTTVRPGPSAPRYWWTLLPLGPEAAPGQAVLELQTGNGLDVERAELGAIATEPSPASPGPADGRRLQRAIAAAGDGELIAICMATYEPSSDLFRRQVDSIKAQTHSCLICLISDDGSSPECRAAMEKVVGDDPRFVFLENEDRVGFYANFERALAAVPAEAGLVALADQDDRWYPDKLAALVAAMGDHDLAYGDMRIVQETGELISDTYWNRRRNNYTDLASLLVGNTVTGAVTLFRADLLARALPFPPRRGNAYHDHWIALMAMTGRGISYVDRPLQDYIQHGSAAQGHEEANAGAGYLQLRMLLGLAWQALGALLGRPTRKGWASRYFEMYLRTVMWAKVALMRSSSLDRRQERILQRVINSGSSPASLFWLAGRSMRPMWGANEAFGRELLLLSSVAWMWSLKVRSRIVGRI